MSKQKTYGDLKQRKAEIRSEIEKGNFENYEEYRRLLQRIKDIESFLLWKIVCGLALAFILGGCCTMSGAGKDVQRLSDGWMEQQANNR